MRQARFFVRMFRMVGLALTLCAACSTQDDPAAAVQGFLAALARKDSAAAYDALSVASQRRVDDALMKARAQGAAVEGDPRQVAFQQAFSLGDSRRILAVELRDKGAERAVVKLTDRDYQTQELTLVRERGAWKLDLVP